MEPTGALEEDTVLTLAQCIWLKRRVERFYHREATGGKDKDEIRFITYLIDMLDSTQTLQRATLITSHLPEFYQKFIAEEVPRSKFEDDKSWIKSLTQRIVNLVVAQANFAAATQCIGYKANKATYLRELTAKKITLDERLDARIDRVIKRLALLKTYKQIVEDRASLAKTIDHRTSDQRQ